MKDTIFSQRRRLLLSLLLTPSWATASRAVAQTPANVDPDLRHRDSTWEMALRPSESEGITRIVTYYRDHRLGLPRASQPSFEKVFSATKAVLEPGNRNWSALLDAYWNTKFLLSASAYYNTNWGVCAYTARGLTRVFTFSDASPDLPGKGRPGSLDSESVFVQGPLPDLLARLQREGELKFS